MNCKCISRGTRESGAVFSQDGNYRYLLWRVWADGLTLYPVERWCGPMHVVAFIGLNPSIASDRKNDPTVTRCIHFAKAWGFLGMYMLNLHAWRATDPKQLVNECNPTGPLNDDFILRYTSVSARTICCWGNGGLYRGRGRMVEILVSNLYHFGLTKKQQPKHPLYLPKNLQPQAYRRNLTAYSRQLQDR